MELGVSARFRLQSLFDTFATYPRRAEGSFEGKLVPITRGRGDYQLRAALKAAGIGSRIHLLRHRAATELLRSTNGNLKLVKEALGHASIQSTQRYANVSETDKREAFARISRNSPEATDIGDKKSDAK